jgi:hypothetical protein
MSVAESFDLHRANGHISIDRHVKSRVVELGLSIESRIAIYLDVNFWILLRDVTLGFHRQDSEQELLRLLRRAVASGAVLCPASDAIFLELLKQSDPSSRVATARLIDELSLGVTLLNGQARMGTEVGHFIHSFDDDACLHPLHYLVWSKLSYVLGFMHPSSPQFHDETQLVVQKAFLDYFWDVPLATVVGMIDDVPNADGLRLDGIGQMLTEGNARHADELRSFEQALRAELRGVADLCADMAAAIISDIDVNKGIAKLLPGTSRWTQCRTMCINLLTHALTEKPETRLQLRTLYIEAALHAALRWDKARPFKGNDFYDFNHAGAALGYCRGFFTEQPLHALITSKKLRLDQVYDCHVASDVSGAIAFLRTLDQGTSAPLTDPMRDRS